MNMTQEMLEILIGKYLDGEITPTEQSMLEAELDSDAQAKELLRQMTNATITMILSFILCLSWAFFILFLLDKMLV